MLLLCMSSIAQTKYLNRELQLENDNDAYTLDFTRDQYYSNGVAIRYRQLLDSSSRKSSTTKVIRSFDLNHRIYTPKRLFWTEVEEMDRPYAGQATLAVSNEYYYRHDTYLKLKVEAGWMGPALYTGEIQYQWHKLWNMTLPEGWEYQINNAPLFNAYGTYTTSLAKDDIIEFLAESNLAIGTSFTHVRQELMIRIGSFKPIRSSTHYNSVLGIENKGPANHEFYFFFSPGFEYVFYNATIEGNPFGREAIYTEIREPWVFQMRSGLMMSWTKFDLALLYYRRTKETTESTYHKYVGIRLNQRF